MKIQGTVSELETRQIDTGTLKRFRLHPKEGRDTQVETRSPIELKDGDMVEADGTINSDLVLLADSVSVVTKNPEPSPFPWKWVIAGIALLAIAALVLFLVFANPAKSSLRVLAEFCFRPAPNTQLQLLDGKGAVIKTEQTNAQGICVFDKLKKDNYTVKQNTKLVKAALDGKASQSVTLNLTPPNVFCLRPPIVVNPGKAKILQTTPDLKLKQVQKHP